MNIAHDSIQAVALAFIIFGIAKCFFGFRIFKIVLGLLGFTIGAILAGTIGYYLSGGTEIITIVAGLVGGIIGSSLMAGLFMFGIFVLGAGLGLLLGGAFSVGSGGSPEPIILIVLAVIGGILALAFHQLMIVLSTSFIGASGIVLGSAHFLGIINLNRVIDNPERLRYLGGQFYIMALLVVLFGIAGIVVQYKYTGKESLRKVEIEKSQTNVRD